MTSPESPSSPAGEHESAAQHTLLRMIDARGAGTTRELSRLMPRLEESDALSVKTAVSQVISRVREEGYQALAEMAERFDGGAPEKVRIPAEVIEASLEKLDPRVEEGLCASIQRARSFAETMMPSSQRASFGAGAEVSAVYTPVDRVGIYVPGGLAVYPSSVVMNVVPAQVAGVASIALCTPPQKEYGGLPHPTILAAAALLGIDEVYAVGGAQAIAALAYGVGESRGEEGIEPVDVITGPGNAFVAEAKSQVRSVVGIDAEAGPTEIAILADSTAEASFLAADLISQAEHDPRAASVLITDDSQLLEQVRQEVRRQAEKTSHRERVLEALNGEQSAAILVRDLEQGIHTANAYAAEHLEIHTRNAREVASRIKHAGAVFVGAYTPVSLGDYCAGSNHVLPTSGTARRASGLNVMSFLKLVQIIEYPKDALEEVAVHVRSLADAENLPAHADAVEIRFESSKEPTGDLPSSPKGL